MNRLLVVRCPDLLDEDEDGATLRLFAKVIEAIEAYCPWVTVVRPGICSLPARGPARYFGGEGPLAQRITDAAAGITPVGVGVADGLFAAVLAARSNLIVPAGGTPGFLAPFPVDVLGRPSWPSCWAGWASAPWATSPPSPSPMCSAGSEPTASPATRWPGGGAVNWTGCASRRPARRTGGRAATGAAVEGTGGGRARVLGWGERHRCPGRLGPWPPCRTSSARTAW